MKSFSRKLGLVEKWMALGHDLGGAIIVNDETVKSGIRIPSPASDEKTNNTFIEALKNPEKQEFLRQEALALKDSFGWDKVAQQWHEEFIAD